MLQWRVEAWTIPGDEEGTQLDMEESRVFDFSEEAMNWAWERMEEGFQTRVYRCYDYAESPSIAEKI